LPGKSINLLTLTEQDKEQLAFDRRKVFSMAAILKIKTPFVRSDLSKVSSMLCVVTLLAGCVNMENSENLKNRATIQSYQASAYKPLKGQRVVLVGGCFDVLHIGHIEFLSASKKNGDYLIVALEPDASIKNYKKRKPVHTQLQRAKILSHLRDVDEVLLLPSLKGFEAYKKLVEDINPSVIGITQGDPQINNKKLQAQLVGAKIVEVMPHLEGYSSSKIIGHR
jgi:FAD synthetase